MVKSTDCWVQGQQESSVKVRARRVGEVEVEVEVDWAGAAVGKESLEVEAMALKDRKHVSPPPLQRCVFQFIHILVVRLSHLM